MCNQIHLHLHLQYWPTVTNCLPTINNPALKQKCRSNVLLVLDSNKAQNQSLNVYVYGYDHVILFRWNSCIIITRFWAKLWGESIIFFIMHQIVFTVHVRSPTMIIPCRQDHCLSKISLAWNLKSLHSLYQYNAQPQPTAVTSFWSGRHKIW